MNCDSYGIVAAVAVAVAVAEVVFLESSSSIVADVAGAVEVDGIGIADWKNDCFDTGVGAAALK